MKEKRLERIARLTGRSQDKALFKTHFQKLTKKQRKFFWAIFIHCWASSKALIDKQNFFNLWCELNYLCHELDESFPDPYDDREAIRSYCHAHPYYFIDILKEMLNQQPLYSPFTFGSITIELYDKDGTLIDAYIREFPLQD